MTILVVNGHPEVPSRGLSKPLLDLSVYDRLFNQEAAHS